MSESSIYVRQEGRGKSVSDYFPLISLTAISAAGGLAIASAQGAVTMLNFMHGFMGFFLVAFSMLKIFNLKGFRRGFKMYDLLARQIPAYAFIYPFIELGLGLAYLGHVQPQWTYIATIVVFSFGTLGVISALRRGLDIDCPCMGSILSVPLSTVTLTEDLVMVAMAVALLVG